MSLHPPSVGDPRPAFTARFRARADECDLFGHVNNAVYLHYLRQATLDAQLWPSIEAADWAARLLRIDYRAPSHAGDELLVAVRLLAKQAAYLRCCEYEITRAADSLMVASAAIEWRTLPDSSLRLSSLEQGFRQDPPPGHRDNGAKPYGWEHSVGIDEPEAPGRVSLGTWFRWLETAVFDASARAGWPLERMRSEDFLSVVVRHEAEFFGTASYGDRIAVVSRLIEVRAVRGTWLHEVHHLAPSALLMRDYATGAFLDWQGNIRRGPRAMLDALVRGDGATRGGGEA